MVVDSKTRGLELDIETNIPSVQTAVLQHALWAPIRVLFLSSQAVLASCATEPLS